MMDIARIDMCVHDKSLGTNAVIAATIAHAKAKGGRLHLFGLVSNGGVHSMDTHLARRRRQAEGVAVVVHAFLDGRDVAPARRRAS